MNLKWRMILIGTAACAALLPAPAGAGGGAGAPQLSLKVSGGNGPVLVGDLAIVTLTLTDLGGEQAAGFQAFLEFDETRLLPVSVIYTPFPFGLPIITPPVVSANTIDLAAGIDVFAGQMPTSSDSALAVVQFIVLQDSGCVNSVFFRESEPPTLVTDAFGEPMMPMILHGLGSGGASDLDGDGAVGVTDLLVLLANWGPCSPNEPCPADLDCDGNVGVSDLLLLLSQWG